MPLMGCQAECWVGCGFVLADGVTHWSLTGSQGVDKDAFLSFGDGVSQSGTGCPCPHAYLSGCLCSTETWVPVERAQLASSIAVVSAEVEMTAYALLTYTLLGDVAAALPVVKWLSQQRNALGGFSSTQVSRAGPERTGSGQGHCRAEPQGSQNPRVGGGCGQLFLHPPWEPSPCLCGDTYSIPLRSPGLWVCELVWSPFHPRGCPVFG